MAHIVFSEIVDTNMVTIVAMDDAPMNFIARVNGNIRPLSNIVALIGAEAFRAARGPIVGMPG
jgi:hypothetical protein